MKDSFTMESGRQAEALQRTYYERTADSYDERHILLEPEHNIALVYISALLRMLSVREVLDVGCGTGRSLAYLHYQLPNLRVIGLEPVKALLDLAIAKHVSKTSLIVGDGRTLPFPDSSFDAVFELGVLHHTPDPDLMVREMLRVARKAVFISDGNIFGQGKRFVRLLKFILYQVGLWRFVKLVQTRGRGYSFTEGDGIAYSYSVYFQYQTLSAWADRVIAIPLASASPVKPGPSTLFNSSSILLCAIRDAGQKTSNSV
jgi:ubiquinone/menaquinone biosynthesis C-methylase UbiE